MKEKSFSMWEGKENWFKYEKTSGLRDFPEAMPLGFTATKIALRSLKYHLEDEMGVEITDELFIDIFRKVCNFNPKGTIEEVYEPFLIMEGFIKRTPRGRMVTELAYRHFGRNPYSGNIMEPNLFD